MAASTAKRLGAHVHLYGDAAAGVSRRLIPHLFTDYERARHDKEEAEIRMQRFADTIRLLIDGLPAADRVEYQRRFEDVLRGSAPQRGGELFGNVIALFRRDQRLEWTVADAQVALARDGVSADTKALYNAFTYLASSGRLQRVARGRYVVTGLGIGVETSDELGRDDGTRRVSEHDF